jgi:hypothetical protein
LKEWPALNARRTTRFITLYHLTTPSYVSDATTNFLAVINGGDMTLREDIIKALKELRKNKDKTGPSGCKCQTLAHHLVGDGCDECQPELAKELAEDDDGKDRD